MTAISGLAPAHRLASLGGGEVHNSVKSVYCHSRESGSAWIPAFAGMTRFFGRSGRELLRGYQLARERQLLLRLSFARMPVGGVGHSAFGCYSWLRLATLLTGRQSQSSQSPALDFLGLLQHDVRCFAGSFAIG